MIYLSFFDIDERVIKASEKAMELCKDKLAEIDDIQEYNQQKMIKAFQLADVRESHLWGSTGYGYDDAMFLMQKTHLSVITLSAVLMPLQLHFSAF